MSVAQDGHNYHHGILGHDSQTGISSELVQNSHTIQVVLPVFWQSTGQMS